MIKQKIYLIVKIKMVEKMKIENLVIRKSFSHIFGFDMFLVSYDTEYTINMKKNEVMSKQEIIDLIKMYM